MLQIVDTPLPRGTTKVLDDLQKLVDIELTYPECVGRADALWKSKTNKAVHKEAFLSVKAALEKISYGIGRCAYCEDSAADEIEHLWPKSLFPQLAFRWSNYAFACGPCNGPKSNRFAIVENDGTIDEFVRSRGGPVVAPRNGTPGLIDPRAENPLALLELDLGGRTPAGVDLKPTFMIKPAFDLAPREKARSTFTIDVLGLNRELVRRSRANAFGSFRALLVEYVNMKEGGATVEELDEFRLGLLGMPHLTVFEEMRRQRRFLPKINNLMARATEIETWKITPGGGQLNVA
jgi:uncharacterized protein (TIGR02646 family)